MTAALPDRRPARVTLRLADGRRLSAATATNRGDWADPYPVADLEAKFLSLGRRVWGEAGAARVWSGALALPRAESVAPLLALLPGSAGGPPAGGAAG